MLALIAGQGRLPALLAARMNATQTRFHAFEMAGYPANLDPSIPLTRFQIETLGSFLNTLVTDGFKQVCFAGSIRRPQIDTGKIDAETDSIAPRIYNAISLGDDAALREITALFVERGLEIVAASDIAADLLPPAGCSTQVCPTATHKTDARRAAQVIKRLGALDIGQACVVGRGQVLAIETLQGTDFMLRGLDRNGPENAFLAQFPNGGILFKGAKPEQDMRLDMPTIGSDTVELAVRAELEGITISAGQVMVLDLPQVIKRCNHAGLFLWVREDE